MRNTDSSLKEEQSFQEEAIPGSHSSADQQHTASQSWYDQTSLKERLLTDSAALFGLQRCPFWWGREDLTKCDWETSLSRTLTQIQTVCSRGYSTDHQEVLLVKAEKGHCQPPESQEEQQ